MPHRPAPRMCSVTVLTDALRTFPDDSRADPTTERDSARFQVQFFRVRPRPDAEIACAHGASSGAIAQTVSGVTIWAWMLRLAGSRYCARGIGGTPRLKTTTSRQGDINEDFPASEHHHRASYRAGAVGSAGVGLCQCRRGEKHCQFEELGHAGWRHVQPALHQAEPDQQGQRRQDAGRLDLLDRCAARPRRLAAGHRRQDVPAFAVPEQGLRDRPRHAEDPVEVRAQARPGRDPADVLRHRQPRPRVCRGQGHLAAG